MAQFKHILVVVPAQLGDALLCTPLIRAAHSQWPDARIDVLGFAGTLGLLQGNPDVSELIEVSRKQSAWAQVRQAARLARRYDLALVTRTTDRAHLYGLVAARRRSALVPPEGPGSRWKHRLAQHRVTPRAGQHQVLEKLQLLSPWLDLPASLALVPPASAPLPPDVQTALRHPLVVVHVPSMWRYKQWPTAHFRALIIALLERGLQVALTGSASANDQALVAAVRDAGGAPQLLDVSGRLSLAQVRTLLEQADAYVGPDTSVTHLAAALAVPTVSVFGPTGPDEFGPWPRDHAALQPWVHRAQRQEVHDIVLLQGPDLPGLTCVPCNRMGCEHRHDSASHCLEHLAPERVVTEVFALLEKQSARAAHSSLTTPAVTRTLSNRRRPTRRGRRCAASDRCCAARR